MDSNTQEISQIDKYAHMGDTLVVPPEGEVLLSQKIKPTTFCLEDVGNCEQQLIGGEPWVFTRGNTDVSSFKDLIMNASPLVWEVEHQATHNVNLTRAGHDQWGIGKVVFIYCDDYLKRVYELPWFHDPSWRQHLDGIFEKLGVLPEKVVRCLLASIPPGVTIPVHHDTGYWVKFTHRIHVPIITSEEVIFRVGSSEDSMARIAFEEGKIIELNNQCKHYVHNGWSQTRIHLIFDYVEDFPVQRIQLQPGDKLTQTRRSVDLAVEQGTRPVPSFIIIGAQKAGTTSVYEYLAQHNLVLRARRRETHFFDWRWQSQLQNSEQRLQFYEGFFHKATLKLHPSLLTGESTPSYLLNYSVVIPRILETLPHRPKIIVILRDPVHRAYSQYQMMKDTEGNDEQKRARGHFELNGRTFEQLVAEEIEELKSLNITPKTSPEEFAEKYISTRPANHGGHSLLGRGLYALQLKPWMDAFDSSEMIVLTTEEMKSAEQAQKQMDKVFQFLGIPPEELEDKEPKNTRAYETMDDKIKVCLYDFFEPFNLQLFELLGSDLGWKHE